MPRLLLLAGVLLGTYLRLRDVAGAFLFGDEFHSLRHLRLGFAAAATTFEPNGSGLALPLLQGALAAVLGANHWSLRLPAAAGSVGALLLVHPAVRRTVGGSAALAATLLVAVNGLLVFYGHFGRAYALASALTLVLLWSCARLLDAPRARDFAYFALATALLPWVHLATLAIVGGVVAGATLALLADPARRRRLAGLAAATLGGGAGAALLYAPAWESTMAFVHRKTEEEQYYGRFAAGDVLVLVAGHWTLALALAVAAALGALVLLRRRRADALPLLLSALAPWVALWAARPFGDPYAYARYVLPAVAPLLVLAGVAIAALARHLAPGRNGVAAAVAAATAAGVLLRGPLGIGHRADGPYANVYLGMLPLPPFDAPSPDTPAFYRALADAGPVTLIETPALMNRSRHLYRDYYLQHGQRTLLGFLPEEIDDPPAGPYVTLAAPAAALAARADFLVVHRDAAAEVARYWRFVFGLAAAGGAPGERAVLERQRQYGWVAQPRPELIARLERELGAPAYADRDLLVWDLRRR